MSKNPSIVDDLANHGVDFVKHVKCMGVCKNQSSCTNCPCRGECVIRKCFYADPSDESSLLGCMHATILNDAEKEKPWCPIGYNWIEKMNEELAKYPTYSE